MKVRVVRLHLKTDQLIQAEIISQYLISVLLEELFYSMNTLNTPMNKP